MMEKVGSEKGLIRYASENGIAQKQKLKITPRILAYSFVLTALVGFLVVLLATRKDIDTTILRTPGMLFQKQENNMIRIGDFARIGQVSVVTVRHYDEIDLLKPIAVDSATGYRYYSVSQLPRLNRILALKDLGFTLDQIRLVLNGLTADQLRGMLIMKQAETQQHIAEEQARLARIEARLKQIESEDRMPEHDVVLKTSPATWIASRTVTIPTNDQVPVYLDPALFEAYGYAMASGAKVIGDWFAIWHQPAEIRADEVAEAAVPIDGPVPGSERVKVYELPQTQVASVIHHGAFVSLVQEHTAAFRWIESNGYEVVGPYREIYIKHDRNTMADAATEIQYPVERRL